LIDDDAVGNGLYKKNPTSMLVGFWGWGWGWDETASEVFANTSLAVYLLEPALPIVREPATFLVG